jgi:hypothetical protein
MPNLLMTDPWAPPDPPTDADPVQATDPRVDITHAIGELPCPKNPAPPVGWAYWTGAVTPDETALAEKMLHDPEQYPMGSFVQTLVGGALVGARVEWHNLQGKSGRVGCFRGVNLMKPTTLA